MKKMTIEEHVKAGNLIPFEKVLEDFDKEYPGSKARIKRMSDEYIAVMELKELRRKQNVSQYELSKRSGVSRAKISKIENGQQNATIKTLYKLADALGKKMEIRFIG